MSFSRWLLLATLFSSVPAWCGHTLTQQEQKILDSWLSKHPTYSAATDADCGCPEDIQRMRTGYGGTWPSVRDYHPYAVTGDFNSDGVRDFAVVVIDRSKSAKNFTQLVFNGPFGPKSVAPVYVDSDLDMQGTGMFFGPPRPKPYRLITGPFESDNAWMLVPKGHTYKVQVNEDE